MASCTCQKCRKTMDEINFYTYKDGTKTEYCKKCLTMHIDNFDESTFLWLLEKMDVPYVPEEWNVLRDKAFAKDPTKMNGMSVFGKYLSKMKLRQWKEFHWADSAELQKRAEFSHKVPVIQESAVEAELKKQFQEGKITEAQYKTLISVPTQYQDALAESHAAAITGLHGNNPYIEENLIDKSELPDITAELTQEDKIYLAMKWGADYPLADCVKLEQKFVEMQNSFDIQDSDTIGTLTLICKTYLKMNQAIDMGDMESYGKLSRVYDSLRKSAKFTAAQNKEKKDDFVDCIGEMVAYCEKTKGQIPEFKAEEDRDVIDTIIRDGREYLYSLIKEDTALARQIEEYIKKREIADQQKRDRDAARAQGLMNVPIDDTDIQAHYDRIHEEIQQDQILYNAEDDE